MTVNTTTITSGPYVGTNLTNEFTYDFRITADTELKVFQTAAGAETSTLLVLTTDYTVTGAGAETGTIVLTAGNLETGGKIFIRSDYDATQLTSFRSQGRFSPEIHEDAFDKLTRVSQQLLEARNRSLTLAEDTTTAESITIEAPITGRSVVWDADGNLANTPTTIQGSLDAAASSASASEVSRLASGVSASASEVSRLASGVSADESEVSRVASGVSAAASEVSRLASGVSETNAALSAASVAPVPSRNSVQNQDPVSQGTAARAGMSSTIYTGNGTSQAVSTGIDMATGDFGGLVWVKERSSTSSHQFHDTVRGTGKFVFPDTTSAENTDATSLTSFNSDGFSVGSNVGINQNTITMAAWSWQTTEKTAGVTNRNKAYTCHYNADLGFSMTGFEGDGVEGHEIPHYLGKEPELVMWKNRDTVDNWIVTSSLFQEGNLLILNGTNELQFNATFYGVLYSDTTTTIKGSWQGFNGSTQNIIQHAFTSIPNVSKIGTYIGTGAAGNHVDCGFKVGWLLVKNLTSALEWVIIDASRGDDAYFYANTSGADAAFDYLDFVADGFVTKISSSRTNTLNSQYLFMAYAEGTTFDGTKTLTNYDYATTDEVLTINEGTLMSFAEGFNANGELNSQELVGSGVTYSFGTGFEDKTLWVYKDRGGVYGSTEFRPLEGVNRAQADKFGLVSPLDAATRTTDKHFGYESSTGVALASGENAAGQEAWKAFDDFNSGWIVTSATTSFLQYKFVEPRVLKSWRLKTLTVSEDPKRFTIEGSNNGLVWTAIDSTYTAADYTGNGVSLWGDLQDTSANTTAYVYHRINITANNGAATVTSIRELEFNTITPSDYYNVVDGKTYNNAGTVIARDYLAKVVTGASGEILNYENLPVAKLKGVDAELQGGLTVHGDISNRGAATAWVNFDSTTNPPTIRDSENVYDVVDLGTGNSRIIFETPMDTIGYSVADSIGSAGNSDGVGGAHSYTINSVDFTTRTGNNALANREDISLTIFGGKVLL